jgi:hypothetical protein
MQYPPGGFKEEFPPRIAVPGMEPRFFTLALQGQAINPARYPQRRLMAGFFMRARTLTLRRLL